MPRHLSPIVRRTALALGLLTLAPAPAVLAANDWQPVPTERLMRLPGAYIDKAVENDFLGSPLARELDENRKTVRGKVTTLSDIKSALETAEGETRLELQHRFLMEKSAYLDLMQEQQRLRREAVDTRMTTYERLLDKIVRDEQQQQRPEQIQLRNRQNEAQARLEQHFDQINQVLSTGFQQVDDSDYASEYQDNLARIEQLQAAIRQHAANRSPSLDGMAVSRKDYIRHLIQEKESELALMDQEQQILAYMAKLIALDAQALENDLQLANLDARDPDAARPTRLGENIDFFLTN